jgi:tRNA(fMet)-specific endonuclease VapC
MATSVPVRYLLDSNVLSEQLKLAPNQRVIEKIATEHAACATASVVVMELYWGADLMPAGKRRKFFTSAYDTYFKNADSMPVLTFDMQAALWSASENARLQKLGLVRSWRDSQIAAIAATQNLILVTRNVADFKPFKQLKIENWFEA